MKILFLQFGANLQHNWFALLPWDCPTHTSVVYLIKSLLAAWTFYDGTLNRTSECGGHVGSSWSELAPRAPWRGR